jgi:hypothetical protein
MIEPADQEPDIQSRPTKASIYATSLFPEVRGIALFDPMSFPARLNVADVGIMECGQFRRIYNAMDEHNQLGLPMLPSASLDGPIPSTRNLYLSAGFQLDRSGSL